MKLLFNRKWVLELGIVVFSAILFILNDWILIATWRSFFLGIGYYIVLYAHAQINRFFILPFITKKQNPLLYFLLTILLLLCFALILSQLADLYFYKTCFLNNNPVKTTFHYQLGVLLGSYICITGTTMFVEYYQQQKDQADKEIMSNKTTIDLLNRQLNPHFLFNTLNTIYGLSIEFPERTPDTVLKVSELLRYQVENSNKYWVQLKNEIEFIESYIAIEKERIGYRCTIEFTKFIDDVDKYQIAPMIIFTFVENAFKHGTDNINGNFILIELKIENGILELMIKNSLSKTKNKIVSTKVGLKNTQARLQMIYPERHHLSTIEKENQFETNLKITL